MNFLATTALLLSAAIASLAAPVAAPTAAIQTGCKNPAQSALAFRSLTSDILKSLQTSNLKATFFLDPVWVGANPYVVQQARDAGHNFGLAITNPTALVQNVPCVNCVQPVNQVALDAYVADQTKLWNNHFGWMKLNLNLVAFPNEDYMNQIYSHMKENKFGALESALVAKGLSPVVVPFGTDPYIFESAGQHNVVLSNIVDPSSLAINMTTPVAVSNFYSSRSTIVNKEDVNVVKSAVSFVATIGKTVVPATQCFGFPAN
ncbi:hypothetical protein BDR26DRAFT_874933 [Obelidium mucronatum]|nr:hypothetical protein BDR26DRAFT_874933 [Obelidium mucronatum]